MQTRFELGTQNGRAHQHTNPINGNGKQHQTRNQAGWTGLEKANQLATPTHRRRSQTASMKVGTSSSAAGGGGKAGTKLSHSGEGAARREPPGSERESTATTASDTNVHRSAGNPHKAPREHPHHVERMSEHPLHCQSTHKSQAQEHPPGRGCPTHPIRSDWRPCPDHKLARGRQDSLARRLWRSKGHQRQVGGPAGGNPRRSRKNLKTPSCQNQLGKCLRSGTRLAGRPTFGEFGQVLGEPWLFEVPKAVPTPRERTHLDRPVSGRVEEAGDVHRQIRREPTRGSPEEPLGLEPLRQDGAPVGRMSAGTSGAPWHRWPPEYSNGGSREPATALGARGEKPPSRCSTNGQHPLPSENPE